MDPAQHTNRDNNPLIDVYKQQYSAETAKLAATAVDDLRKEIPHIEGWTVGSLIGHTGWVYRFVDLCLAATPDTPPSRASVPEPPPGEEVLAWAIDGAQQLDATLGTTDFDVVRPTWTGPQPALWWLRRIALEVAVHRWDSQAAIGAPDPIDAALAVDGIDEILEVFAPNRMQFPQLNGNGETVHLHATDVEHGEWVLTYQPDRVDFEHDHRKCDVAARGTASDLLLMMWSRLPASRLEIFGDESLLNRWQTAAKF